MNAAHAVVILVIATSSATGMALAATGPTQPQITASSLSKDMRDQVVTAVRDLLKDPDAAQFKYDHAEGPGILGDEIVICGQVNGKNSFGGYVGFSPFAVTLILSPGSSKFTVSDIQLSDSRTDMQAFYQKAPQCNPARWKN